MAYKDAPDLLKHLETVFADPNRQVNARKKYHDLTMRLNQDFNDFLAEFVRLAEEAEIVEEHRKEDLYHKITYKLQDLVMDQVDDATVDFEKFARHCQNRSTRISLRNVTTAARGRGRGWAGSISTPTTTPTTSRTTPQTVTTTDNAQVKIEPGDRMNLLREGRCFICRKQGHIGRDCPDRKTSALNATVLNTNIAAPSRPDLITFENDNDEAGKA
jgi:hypothetical protein